MSDEPRRQPAAFRVDADERVRETRPETGTVRVPRAIGNVSPDDLDPEDAVDEADIVAAENNAVPRRRGFPFAKVFLAAIGTLASIAIGLAVDDLVRNLFSRADWLGWAAVGVAAIAAFGALGIVAREAIGLMRLAALGRERQAAARAFDLDSAPEARIAVDTLVAFLASRADTAEGRARLAHLKDEVIDGRDLIVLAERELMTPLDAKARALVMLSAKRVSVVTAVSPKAIVDISYVLFENIRLIRRMAELYGARPGLIGLVKLTRDVVGHLAVTGSISMGDHVIGQVVGHGLAARLSARLGEGVLNGLLTARVGVAAMDLCRPLPFLGARRPRINDFASDLMRLQSDAGKPQPPRRGSLDPS